MNTSMCTWLEGEDHLNIVLLGKTGVGKSSTGNTILGEETFKFGTSSRSTTRCIQMDTVTIDGKNITVYDTPGVCHTELSKSDVRKKCETILHLLDSSTVVFLLVLAVGRFTLEDRAAVRELLELLGFTRLQDTWIVFTGGDVLDKDGQSVEEFISKTSHLKDVVQKLQNRHHVLNNKNLQDRNQVKTLIDKVTKTKQQRFTPGDRVRVKASVKEPEYKWGSVSAGSVGTVKAVRGDKMIVDFSEQSGWLGVVSEMELVSSDDSARFATGDRVRVKLSVKEPKYGWGGIRGCSVGTVKAIHGDDLTVDFSEYTGWHGVVSEMELVSSDYSEVPRFKVGDRVKKKFTVTDWEYAWKPFGAMSLEPMSLGPRSFRPMSLGSRPVGTVIGHKLIVKFPGRPHCSVDPSEVKLAKLKSPTWPFHMMVPFSMLTLDSDDSDE